MTGKVLSDGLASDPSRLTVSGLHSGYGNTPIRSDVVVTVANGRMTIPVGPNGSGKSTRLKAMARIVDPVAGAVALGRRSTHRATSQALADQPFTPLDR